MNIYALIIAGFFLAVSALAAWECYISDKRVKNFKLMLGISPEEETDDYLEDV